MLLLLLPLAPPFRCDADSAAVYSGGRVFAVTIACVSAETVLLTPLLGDVCCTFPVSHVTRGTLPPGDEGAVTLLRVACLLAVLTPCVRANCHLTRVADDVADR